MQLKEIYSPIENELNEVGKALEQFLVNQKINQYWKSTNSCF